MQELKNNQTDPENCLVGKELNASIIKTLVGVSKGNFIYKNYQSLFLNPSSMGLLKKLRFTPQPPKGGFINISKSISPPWGI